jgi:hypothetical protein
VAIEEAPDHGGRKALAAVGDQPLLDFQQRDIRLATNEPEQIVAMRFDPLGTAIPARGSRGHLARAQEAMCPTNRAGDADLEALSRRVSRHTALENGLNHSFAKIVGMRHQSRLRNAARDMNHKQT